MRYVHLLLPKVLRSVREGREGKKGEGGGAQGPWSAAHEVPMGRKSRGFRRSICA